MYRHQHFRKNSINCNFYAMKDFLFKEAKILYHSNNLGFLPDVSVMYRTVTYDKISVERRIYVRNDH